MSLIQKIFLKPIIGLSILLGLTSSAWALLDGQVTAEFPAVGLLTLENGAQATGTLIAPRVVLSAGHTILNGGVPWKSGPLKSTFIELFLKGRSYLFKAAYGIALGGQAGKEDVGLIFLDQDNQVPAEIANPMPIAYQQPEKGTEGGVVGFGCDSTKWDQQLGLYSVDNRNGRFLRKQVVYRRYGDLFYQNCYGDSGGPLFNWHDKAIYAVMSGNDFSINDDLRRKIPTHINAVGRVTDFAGIIELAVTTQSYAAVLDYINFNEKKKGLFMTSRGR